MSWVFIVDDKISLLRRHEALAEHTYHEVCKTLASSVAERLSETVEHDCLTVVRPGTTSEDPIMHPFTCDVSAVRDAIFNLAEPNPMKQLTRNFSHLIARIMNELFRYWGPSYPIQILVFTDGGASSFVKRQSSHDSVADSSDRWSNVSLLFVSVGDEKLSEDLFQVHRQFSPNSAILPLNTHQTTSNNLSDVVAEATNAVLRHCLPEPVLDQLTPASSGTRVSIRFGHLESVACLIPAIRSSSNFTDSGAHGLSDLVVEIFGFLHTSDLSNPPVASRHQVRVVQDSDEQTFLSLLLAAMQNTKTVAMCTFSPHMGATASRGKSGTAGGPWRHGFLHQFDAKSSVLLLSIFHQDCSGLPWLGQFQHLAPVADFAGTLLYDDRDGSSPFPVRVPDRLSYVQEQAPSCPPSTAVGVAPSEPFRYISWVSPATITADVNKLLRLGRRLPDKAALFFKEFARLRNAAMAYGCPEILNDVVDLTKASHPSYANGTASEILSTHLDNMCRMLTELDFRPT